MWDCKTGEEAGSCSSWHRPSQEDNTKIYLVSTCRSVTPSTVKTVSARSSISSGASGEEPVCQCRRQELDPWARKIPWRREWQPTPVLLPGEAHGQRSLAGYSPWGLKESDMTLLGGTKFHPQSWVLTQPWFSLMTLGRPPGSATPTWLVVSQAQFPTHISGLSYFIHLSNGYLSSVPCQVL